jgi:predicted dehydrogenase
MVGAAAVEVEVRGERDLLVRWADGSSLLEHYGGDADRDDIRLRFGAATVELDRLRGLRLRGAGLRGSLPAPALLRSRPASTGWERSFERALGAFAGSVRRGEPGSPGPADGLRAVAVGVAIERSMAEGGAQAVDTHA